jgi:UDPglucose 6-dehydrogenase
MADAAPTARSPRSSVGVIGCGYVGLTTAACLSHLGHSVHATDIDEQRVGQLQGGEVPILEPGLGELVTEGLARGSLRFSSDNRAAAAGADFLFLCTATPPGPEGKVDTSSVRAAVLETRDALASGSVVVIKSTCPLGFNEDVVSLLGRDDVEVASNPEFLREGSAVGDFLRPDRIVIGVTLPSTGERLAGLFDGLPGERMILDPTSAELVKYASNTFLATKVTFANSLALLCDAFGADVRRVAAAVGADHRIGEHFLHAGPGFGGSCLPKDTRALIEAAHSKGFCMKLLETVVEVDGAQRDRVVEMILCAASGSLRDKRVAMWGLTFKAGTDDLRCSPALEVADRLVDLGAEVRGYDPAVQRQSRVGPVEACHDRYSACDGASVLTVTTEWDELVRSDWAKVAEVMADPVVVDARNVLDGAALARHGLRYFGLGVASSAGPTT